MYVVCVVSSKQDGADWFDSELTTTHNNMLLLNYYAWSQDPSFGRQSIGRLITRETENLHMFQKKCHKFRFLNNKYMHLWVKYANFLFIFNI